MPTYRFTTVYTVDADDEDAAWDEYASMLTGPAVVQQTDVEVFDDNEPHDGTHTCVLCGITFVGYGNNPEPLTSYERGRCCNDCNSLRVIPTRIRQMQGRMRGESI